MNQGPEFSARPSELPPQSTREALGKVGLGDVVETFQVGPKSFQKVVRGTRPDGSPIYDNIEQQPQVQVETQPTTEQTEPKPYPYGPPSDTPPLRSLQDLERRHRELGLDLDEGRGFAPPVAPATPIKERPRVTGDDEDFSDRTYLR